MARLRIEFVNLDDGLGIISEVLQVYDEDVLAHTRYTAPAKSDAVRVVRVWSGAVAVQVGSAVSPDVTETTGYLFAGDMPAELMRCVEGQQLLVIPFN